MAAAAKARRFVADVLSAADLREVVDDAQLVTSELVANALLHTDSPVRVTVTVTGRTARVDVHDECPTLPVPGVLGRESISGRGLLMVDRMTQRWGVTRVPGVGKSVWFELVAGMPTAADDLSADDLLELWADDDLPLIDALPTVDIVTLGSDSGAADDVDEPSRTVQLDGVRTDLLLHAKEHIDDLVRDLLLAAESSTEPATGGHAHDVKRLGAHLCELASRLLPFRNEIRRQAVEAAQQSVHELTLVLTLPLSMREELGDYQRALDAADEHCRAGRLLLTECEGEHVEFRRWKLNRVIEQLS